MAFKICHPEEQGQASSVCYQRKRPAIRSCSAAPLSNASSPQDSRQRLAAEAGQTDAPLAKLLSNVPPMKMVVGRCHQR